MKARLWEIAQMVFAITIIVVGAYYFKIPNGFSTGGVAGIGTVLGGMIESEFFTTTRIITILNLFMLLLGFIFLGRKVGVRTVFCTLLYSGLMELAELIYPVTESITGEPMLDLIYAILLAGFGSAILFHVHASSGGTDILALILKKYTSLDVGKCLLCVDFLIATTSFAAFGITVGLFSMLGLFAKTFLIDGIIESLNVCKSFTIITTKKDEIVDYILHTMHHSATIADARGAYTNEEKTLVITTCRRAEAVRLQRKAKKIDPDAFLIIESTSEIIGRGFRAQ